MYLMDSYDFSEIECPRTVLRVLSSLLNDINGDDFKDGVFIERDDAKYKIDVDGEIKEIECKHTALRNNERAIMSVFDSENMDSNSAIVCFMLMITRSDLFETMMLMMDEASPIISLDCYVQLENDRYLNKETGDSVTKSEATKFSTKDAFEIAKGHHKLGIYCTIEPVFEDE